MHGTFTDCASVHALTLAERIRLSNNALADMYDPAHGPIGPQFMDAVASCQFNEIIACEAQKCDNVYIPFVWSMGFDNTISYKETPVKTEAFFHSRAHEILHGIAWNNVPVLHASLFNKHSPVVLCPRDWVAMFEMTEADVGAKTAWLMSLMAKDNPAMADATRYLPVSVDEFNLVRSQTKTVDDALTWTAQLGMAKIWGTDERDGSDMSFAAYYQSWALTCYENILKWYEADGIRPALAVRMEQGDACDVGRSFGPNPFKHDAYSVTPLKGLDEARIRALNARLGIHDESHLPTFGDALQWHGHTPQSYLAASKAAVSAPAVQVVPQVVAQLLRVA